MTTHTPIPDAELDEMEKRAIAAHDSVAVPALRYVEDVSDLIKDLRAVRESLRGVSERSVDGKCWCPGGPVKGNHYHYCVAAKEALPPEGGE